MSNRILQLSEIRIDGGTQPRCEIDTNLVSEYAESMGAGDDFPPVIVFFDGVDTWLGDGFHRYHAAKLAGLDGLDADVREGTKRDAILYSVGANADHGQRRTSADKRRAVLILLNDEEWSGWTSAEIARRCHVSHTMVDDQRRSLATPASDQPTARTYTTKHGTTATMNVENIGKKKPWRYGGISPDAHQPVRDAEPPEPRVALELPRNPRIVCAAIFHAFGAEFVGELIPILTEELEKESAVCQGKS